MSVHNIIDLPFECFKVHGSDATKLLPLRTRATRKDGFFLVSKNTTISSVDTFEIAELADNLMYAADEWYLGKVELVGTDPLFGYRILISRLNNDNLGNAYEYHAEDEVDLSKVLHGMNVSGDEEFMTAVGIAAWDMVEVETFAVLGYQR